MSKININMRFSISDIVILRRKNVRDKNIHKFYANLREKFAHFVHEMKGTSRYSTRQDNVYAPQSKES